MEFRARNVNLPVYDEETSEHAEELEQEKLAADLDAAEDRPYKPAPKTAEEREKLSSSESEDEKEEG